MKFFIFWWTRKKKLKHVLYYRFIPAWYYSARLSSTRNSLELFSSSLLTTFSDIRFWKLTFEVEDLHSLLDFWEHSHDHQKSAISPLVREKVKTLGDFFQTNFSPSASKKVFLSPSPTTVRISSQNKHSVAIGNSWGRSFKGTCIITFYFFSVLQNKSNWFYFFWKKWRFLSFGKKWCFFFFWKKMEVYIFFFDSGSFWLFLRIAVCLEFFSVDQL